MEEQTRFFCKSLLKRVGQELFKSMDAQELQDPSYDQHVINDD